jgi:sugar lactone lactonase YvrE
MHYGAVKRGADYMSEWAHGLVAANGTDALFSPAFVPGSGLTTCAYAIYDFTLDGSKLGTLKLNWASGGRGTHGAWIGLANWGANKWDFMQLPDADTTSINDSLYLKDGRVLVALVIAGDETWRLSDIAIGDDWAHTWGGAYNDTGRAVAADPAGNIYVTGYTSPTNIDSDLCVMKYDAWGKQLWRKTCGSGMIDFGAGIAVDHSGNAYVAGYTMSSELSQYGYDGLLLKYGTDGTLLWCKTWNGEPVHTGTGDQLFFGVALSPDESNVYVCGSSDNAGYKAILIKYGAADGQIAWVDSWGQYSETAECLSVASDGSIYVTGNASNFYSGFLIKISPTGNKIWDVSWPATDGLYAHGIATGPDDSVYIGGLAGSVPNAAVILKYDAEGSPKWKSSWSGINTSDFKLGMAIDSQGQIYLTGELDPHTGNLIRLAPDGTLSGAEVWHGVSDSFFAGVAVLQDGQVAICGNARRTEALDGAVANIWEPRPVTASVTSPWMIGYWNTPANGLATAFTPATVPEGSFDGIADTGGGGEDLLVMKHRVDMLN